jgi:hypothetical protein
VDRNPLQVNIDVFCMSAIPNPKNSELLDNLCERFNLSDPYRILYLSKRDYSYVPFGNVRLNRSRLDFFIVSQNILREITDCCIDHSVSCKLFDHKRVTFTAKFETPNSVKTDRLGNNYLNDILMMANVELAARKTAIYALKLDSDTIHPTFGTNREIKEREMPRLVSCDALIDNVLKGREKAIICQDEAASLLVAGYEAEIKLSLEDMIPLDELYSLMKQCSVGDFFEHLVMYTWKHGSKMQKKLHRLKKIRKENLESRLASLKQDYSTNVC